MEAIINKPTAIINRFSAGRSSIVGYHRFLKNNSVTYELIMESHYNYLSQKVSGSDLICIQDTTEFNYQHHSGLIAEGELGTISDGTSLGMRAHPVLVSDAKDGFVYGLSSLQIFNRKDQTGNRHERSYKALPIEQKESYRWLSSIQESKIRLAHANSLTFVSDRESDIYQLWSRIPDERTHLVIRSCFTRKFTDLESDEELSPDSEMTFLGQSSVQLPARANKKRKSRTAILDISAQKLWTLKPKALKEQKTNQDPERIGLTMVRVKEVVPAGTELTDPVEWFLLTDLPVNSLDEALAIVDIYKRRWHIEQLFRLSKKQGFGLEESQLERAHSLQNMMAMVFIAGIRIYQMVCGRDNQDRNGSDVFDHDELELLEKLRPPLEGKTERSKNKNKAATLAYYLWVVARLGNWKPEDRDPPGPITFKRGWETLENHLRITRLIPP